VKLEFISYCGHQPWFFVPDTGTPGGSAVLRAPDGTESVCVNTQLDPKVWSWPALGDSFTAPRMGFEVPGIFVDPGVYTLIVTQDDADGNPVVDEYTIDVRLDLVVLVEHGALGELSRLNQIRQLLGRPPFLPETDQPLDGFTDAEAAELRRAEVVLTAHRQRAATKQKGA
jgi:hypothetical protein